MRRITRRHPTPVNVKLILGVLLLAVLIFQYYFVVPFIVSPAQYDGNDNHHHRQPDGTFTTGKAYKNIVQRTNETLFFVHVGKSGGETIKWRLRVICNIRASARKRAICHEQFSSQAASAEGGGGGGGGGGGESQLSKHTIGYMHCNLLRPKNKLNDASTLFFSIRDPMDRIISWFQYMHPSNCLPSRPSAACNLKKQDTTKDKESYNWGQTMFETCFHDVNDMIKSIQQTSPTNGVVMKGDINCTRLAIDTITGNGPPGPSNHLYFNYHYYWNRTTTLMKLHQQKDLNTATNKKNIVVVRQESLWDDLRSIEYMLGGNSNRKFENEGPIVTHNSELFPYRAILDTELMPILCCAIPTELTIYIHLISNALNIDPFDRISTIEKLYTKCNIPMIKQERQQSPNNSAQLFLSKISAKCHWKQQADVSLSSISATMELA